MFALGVGILAFRIKTDGLVELLDSPVVVLLAQPHITKAAVSGRVLRI
jgi:hypothetical protein